MSLSVCAKICRKKRRAHWRDKNWILHHDIEQTYSAISTSEFLTKSTNSCTSATCCFQDVVFANFYLCPKLKILLKGKRFDLNEDIQINKEAVFNTFQKENFK